QPKSELVWKIKQEKFSVFREWRDSDEGKAADYKQRQAHQEQIYRDLCQKYGLPVPNKIQEEIIVDDHQSYDEPSDEDSFEGFEDDSARLFRTFHNIPDNLAEPARVPEKWRRIEIDPSPLIIKVSEDVHKKAHTYSSELEKCIRETVDKWLSTEEAEQWAYRKTELLPSDYKNEKGWNNFLDKIRTIKPSLSELLPDSFDIKVVVTTKPEKAKPGYLACHIALEHLGSKPTTAKEAVVDSAIYQVNLKIRLGKNQLEWLPLDRVEPSYRFRDFMMYPALGLNCGINHHEDGNFEFLETAWMPRYVLPRIIPREGSSVIRDYKTLSDKVFDVKELHTLVEEYETWIESIKIGIDPTQGITDTNEQVRERQNFRDDLDSYTNEKDTIAKGIEILEKSQIAFRKDPESEAAIPYSAWRLMNKTFERSGGGKFTEWRLFQIAFILAHIPTLASRIPSYSSYFDAKRDEETASLLYFATGGGKSEAFFGVLIFSLFLDRLRGKKFGVSALLRYPLRLLTVQQARRLFRTLVYAEIIRIEANVSGVAFQLGFWVGASNTPNRLNDSRLEPIPFDTDPAASDEDKAETNLDYLKARRGLNKIPVCPCCGEKTGLRRIKKETGRTGSRIGVICHGKNCDWNNAHNQGQQEPLPFLLVDADIYERAPAVILGTVDKLALIGQHDSTISKLFGMFGLAKWYSESLGRAIVPRYRNDLAKGAPTGWKYLAPLYSGGESVFFDPIPSLIVQDEAHLLEESLGTFAGLFETTLEQVLTRNADLFGDQIVRHPGASKNSPIRLSKIIAATATVSDPNRQTEVLYQRNSVQFPHPGPDIYESFYAQPKTPDDTKRVSITSGPRAPEISNPWSRVYASLMTNGRTHTITTVTILANLHVTISDLLTRLWDESNPAGQVSATEEIIEALTHHDLDPATPLRGDTVKKLSDGAHFDVIASMVDLHKVALTYVTNKKGGDVVLDALQEAVRDAHRYEGLYEQKRIPEHDIPIDLISGGVDMEHIENVMHKAERDRTDSGDFVPLQESLRNIVATSAISHGVDVDRFNSMVFAGLPSDIAEYIQASSRVGRTHVGFSLLVPTPQSRRDRYVVEVHDSFHRFLDRMIAPPAVERWAKNAIARVMPSLFQAWLVGVEEPSRFSVETDKTKAISFINMSDVKRLLGPVSSRKKKKDNFTDFCINAIGVYGRGAIGQPSHRDYYEHHIRELASNLFNTVTDNMDTLAASRLSDFWRSLSDVQTPMTSLRDVEEAGKISPSKSKAPGLKPNPDVEKNVVRALEFIRSQRGISSELDSEMEEKG
ncbi:MAG: helicase-related protein, partial [Magnetovibrio sp.]|nr:helicase-related protein [Magnetovibrio sp.]